MNICGFYLLRVQWEEVEFLYFQLKLGHIADSNRDDQLLVGRFCAKHHQHNKSPSAVGR